MDWISPKTSKTKDGWHGFTDVTYIMLETLTTGIKMTFWVHDDHIPLQRTIWVQKVVKLCWPFCVASEPLEADGIQRNVCSWRLGSICSLKWLKLTICTAWTCGIGVELAVKFWMSQKIQHERENIQEDGKQQLCLVNHEGLPRLCPTALHNHEKIRRWDN